MQIRDIQITENKIVAVTADNNLYIDNLYHELKKIYNFNDIDDINDFYMNSTIDYLTELIDKKKENYETRLEEVLLMVDLDDTLLDRKLSSLSDSELIKVEFAKILLLNPKIIFIKNIFTRLDMKNRNKFFKILIKLKKYYNKTIFIFSSEINSIYEFIDDIIYINSEEEYIYSNKFDLYENNKNLKNIPDIIYFTNLMKNKYHNMKYTDSINELIKELYREIR